MTWKQSGIRPVCLEILRHREARSAAAIQINKVAERSWMGLDCFAPLAMTIRGASNQL